MQDPFEQQRQQARRQEMERQQRVLQENMQRQQQQLQEMGARQRANRRDAALEAEQARIDAGRRAYYEANPEEAPTAPIETPTAPVPDAPGTQPGYVRGTAWSDPNAEARSDAIRQSRTTGPQPRWNGSSIGQARDVSLQSPKMSSEPFVAFRLERYDARSGRLGPVAVRLSGDGALGFVSEGDWVEVAGSPRKGVIDGKRAYNHTTRTDYKRGSLRRLLIPIAVLLFLAWIGFIAVMSFNNLNFVLPNFNNGGGQPGTSGDAGTQPTLAPLPTFAGVTEEPAPRPTYDQVGFETCMKDGVHSLAECESMFPKYDP